MMDQGLLRRNVFSLYLREFNLRGSQGSHIMFGGVDRNAYLGRIRYYGLVEDAYKWIIHMQTVCVAGHEQFWWFKAEIDSGSKYIYGPYEIINAINRQILDREVPLHETALLTNEELAVSDNFREVRFTFGGGDENHVFNLLPQHYICEDEDVPDRYSTVFRPRVFEPEQEPCFTLGLPWLRRYHTTFDFGQRRIGFARSVV
ncbi:PREDICTED: gastricsin-like [Camelina sativa]|uniref:Gastricsin-like n=1 Tax=Camelina sativa TaxID=90675 RepID=A0ABM0XY30_CAMSA|nr:PREDICTED: gastricsin-like [Camelina sativa]